MIDFTTRVNLQVEETFVYKHEVMIKLSWFEEKSAKEMSLNTTVHIEYGKLDEGHDMTGHSR